MADEDKKLMEELNITFEQRTVYYFYYKGEKLSDAVDYAKKDIARSN